MPRLIASTGPDGISLDRRHNDAAEGRGLDTPLGEACGRLLSDQGWPVDLVGGGHEGTRCRSKYFIFSPPTPF